MEEAVFLTKFATKVYIIHRRDKLRASKIMGDRAKQNPKIEIVWDSVVTDILGDNEVEAVKVKNVKTDKEKTIDIASAADTDVVTVNGTALQKGCC